MYSNINSKDIINNIDIGLIGLNKKKEIILWNDWLEKYTQKSSDQTLGKKLDEVFPELMQYGANSRIISAINNALEFDFPAVLSHAFHKSPFPLYLPDSKILLQQAVSIAPLEYDSSKSCLIQIQDVTPATLREKNFEAVVQELKKTQKALIEEKNNAEKANSLKSTFLSIISHEIRTPMNAIIGMVHLALQTKLSIPQLDYLKKINVSAHNLLSIINDILDVSKIEAGKLSIETVDFYLHDVLKNVFTVISDNAHQKNIPLILDASSDLPLMLHGDPLRLEQILTNLSMNAVKFTEQGKVVIHIKLVNSSKNTIDLLFSVQDTGVGMTHQQQTELFIPFTQLDSSTARKYGGTGLGLTICKELVELMGGQIHIESQLGLGSNFYFTLQFEKVASEVVSGYQLPDNLNNIRVLIITDNNNDKLFYLKMLESFNLSVDEADGYEQGKKLLQHAALMNQPFHLVLLDWQIVKNIISFDTAEDLTKELRLSKEAEIILLHSDKDLEDILTRVSGIDLNHLLLKPVSPTSLYDHIVTLFEKKLMDSESEANPLKGSRILVVDDNDFNLQIACEILERAGIIAEAVSEGIKAVELIKNSIKLHTPYDAVLMDIQMPNMSGLDATQIIRQWEQQYSEHKAIPIIALSANAMVDDADKSLASGMNEHLSKPINPNKLLKSLRQWIEIHSKQDQDIDLNSN